MPLRKLKPKDSDLPYAVIYEHYDVNHWATTTCYYDEASVPAWIANTLHRSNDGVDLRVAKVVVHNRDGSSETWRCNGRDAYTA